MRLIGVKTAGSDRTVYFNQAFVSAFGESDRDPEKRWIECAGDTYLISTTLDGILRQIPQEET